MAGVRADTTEVLLQRHARAHSMVEQRVAVFYSLTQMGDYGAAECARADAISWMEAGLDAFTAACRLAKTGGSSGG